MIIGGQVLELIDEWVEDTNYQVVNSDGECFHVLSSREVEGLNDDSYLCTNTEVYKTIRWGEFEIKLLYKNGCRGEYKGRDSEGSAGLELFKDYYNGLPTNKYYLVCEDWEWLYYSEKNGKDCWHIINGRLRANGIEYYMAEEDLVNMYNFLHSLTPTNEKLGLVEDKECTVFCVEVGDSTRKSDDIVTIEKTWRELTAGDWIHEIRASK